MTETGPYGQAPDARRVQNREAQQRWRQRSRSGRSIYRIELHDDLLALFVEAGGVGECDSADREQCEKALAAWLESTFRNVLASTPDEELREAFRRVQREATSLRIKAA